MEGSILEFIGGELIGVISPVSICMLLVVLLVYSLSPTTAGSTAPTSIVSAANLVYAENPADSTFQKLEGALLNAAVFILLVAAMTFLLVLLYYYNFTNFLKHYMRFSAFFVLSFTGGPIFITLLSRFSIPLDALTFSLLLLNFSVLGVVSVFPSPGVPILLTQSYMVALGIIVAAWFTRLPEWTTWITLVAMAVYDLVAVLSPVGPLKILVELAQSRDDGLPAFVYEARPTVSRSGGGGDRAGSGLGLLVAGVSESRSIELQPSFSRNTDNDDNGVQIDVDDDTSDMEEERGRGISVGRENRETSPLVPESLRERRLSSSREGSEIGGGAVNHEDTPSLVEMLGMANNEGEEDGDSDTMSTRGFHDPQNVGVPKVTIFHKQWCK
ncbi:hypothetical protein Dimus_007532 [Dionaea muscipula]